MAALIAIHVARSSSCCPDYVIDLFATVGAQSELVHSGFEDCFDIIVLSRENAPVAHCIANEGVFWCRGFDVQDCSFELVLVCRANDDIG